VLTAKEFIIKNEADIQQEIENIITAVSSEIEKGHLKMTWNLDFAPSGAASFIAVKVRDVLDASGWQCSYTVDGFSRISFEISPNLAYLL
jgi:hypothetical protein